MIVHVHYNLVQFLADDEIISETPANENQPIRKRKKSESPELLSGEEESDTESRKKPPRKKKHSSIEIDLAEEGIADNIIVFDGLIPVTVDPGNIREGMCQ